jgi:monoamine oxidase
VRDSNVDLSRRSLLVAASASLFRPHFGASAQSKRIGSALVIGSGVSGLAAATRLKEAGVDVTIVEADERAGGRVQTDRSLGLPIDLGASWLIGKNPLYQLLLDQQTELSSPSNFESVDLFTANGSKVSTADAFSATIRMQYIDSLVRRWNKHQRADLSVAKVLDRFGAVDGSHGIQGDAVDYFMNLALTLNYAADADKLSARQYETYETQYGSEERFVPEGMSQAVDMLCRGLTICMNSEVHRIDVTAAGVSVWAGSQMFSADVCIVTVPLAVLKRRQIRFLPPLPEVLERSIDAHGVGSFFKLAMRFKAAFWNVEQEFVGSLGDAQSFGKGEHATFVNLSKVVGAPVLVMFLGSPLADRFERQSLKESTEFAMSRLRAIFGKRIAAPIGVTRSNWTTSRYSGGAYSFYAVGSTPQSIEEFHQVRQGRLTFAGEHTSVSNFGTVHGAYNSGIAAAERLLHTKR